MLSSNLSAAFVRRRRSLTERSRDKRADGGKLGMPSLGPRVLKDGASGVSLRAIRRLHGRHLNVIVARGRRFGGYRRLAWRRAGDRFLRGDRRGG